MSILDCIEHGKPEDKDGYARTSLGGRSLAVHRRVYIKTHNLTIDDIRGLVVRHKCDNPRCIEPTHLELGTVQDNVDDRVHRARGARGERQGAAVLTVADVHYIRKQYVKGSRISGLRALARRFKVAPNAIHSVVLGETWKHV